MTLPKLSRLLRRQTCAVVVASFVATASPAMETDQYLTWFVQLTDSAPAINAFVNERFHRVLERANRRSVAMPCERLPGLLFRDLQRTLVTSRLRRFLHRSTEVERFPAPSVGYWRYRNQSVFRRKTFPIFLPMSRTIRIGDVYTGTDKLGHFFGYGRRYYAHYRRGLARGLGEERAQRRAILRGLRHERWLVGGLVDGVVSNGDLEANYQGFRLALDLCHGEDPLLVRTAQGWRLRRDVDLRDYVNPAFDESYHPSHFFAYRWRIVEPVLASEYCSWLDSPQRNERFARYREIDRPSFSRRVIAEQNAAKGRRRSEAFSLESVCARRTDGVDVSP